MNKSIDALKAMLDSLLDISRLEAGVIEADVRGFALCDLLEQVDASYQPVAAAKGLTWQVRPCSARVRSDPVLLGRMVRNLVDNAVKYTKTGYVFVGCKLEDAAV